MVFQQKLLNKNSNIQVGNVNETLIDYLINWEIQYGNNKITFLTDEDGPDSCSAVYVIILGCYNFFWHNFVKRVGWIKSGLKHLFFLEGSVGRVRLFSFT